MELFIVLLLAGLVGTTQSTGNATSPPVNATSPAVNATSLPGNSTSPPVNATSPPVNATSPPVNATSTSANSTSPPVNATSPTVNATSPPVNATSTSTNSTSPPVNATAPTVNATSPPVNVTSPPVNATSPPVNATSPPVNATSPPPGNATSSPMNGTSPPPEPKVKLEFKLQANFTEELSNKSSPAFKALSTQVASALDNVYKAKFGSSFNRTVINGFSQGSVAVDAELVFNEGNSPPNTSSVADTMVQAASSSNFSLSVNTSSIVATKTVPPTQAPTIPAPSTSINATTPPGNATSPPMNGTSPPPQITTAAPAATTTPAPPQEPKVKLEFKLQANFTEELANTSSPAFKALSTQVASALDNVYKAKFGSSFNRTVINGFRKGSVEVDAELVFNEGNSPPNTSSVADTMVQAASSSNFSLSVNTSSIVATKLLAPTVNATSPSPAPAAATTQPEALVQLKFALQQNFTTELENTSSPAFKALSTQVASALDNLYKSKFGAGFSQTVVNSFSRGSVVVNADLVFTNASSVPETNAVANILVEAVSNSSNFSLPVNASTVVATSISRATAAPTTVTITVLTTTSTATAAPTAAPTTAPTVAPTVAPTAAPTTTPKATATATTTASTNPPSSSEGTLGLQFSLDQTFTSDLSDSSSTAFKTLAAAVISQINKIYRKQFSFFSRCIVNQFTSGSVNVDMTLVFNDKASVPSTSSATSALNNALTGNSTSLNIIPGSITTQTTSGSPPRPTVFTLLILPPTLLAVAQMLSGM